MVFLLFFEVLIGIRFRYLSEDIVNFSIGDFLFILNLSFMFALLRFVTHLSFLDFLIKIVFFISSLLLNKILEESVVLELVFVESNHLG